MKIKLSFFLALLLCLTLRALGQEVLEVPVSSQSGYGVFHASMAAVGPETEDSPIKLGLKGIPKRLRNIKRHHLIVDEKQFFYQSYLANTISKEMFDMRMQLLNYEPKENELSEKPLRSSVYILTGEDEKGRRVWMADTDTDLNFSGEKARPLLTYSEPFNFEKYKSFSDNAVQVKYQRLIDGKVVEETFPLAVVGSPEGEYILFNHPKYYTAKINVDGKVYETAVESASFLSKSLDEGNNSMLVLTGKAKDKTVDLSTPVRPNQYFFLGGDVYQYLGVDEKKMVMRISRVQNADLVRSAQIGFSTLDFSGTDFTSGSVMAMEQLKGKYVLLDFWATWCAPCIKEFPRLKDLTARYDSSKFVVLGIIGHSKPEDVTKLIDKHQLTWSQILSDEIVKQHGVMSYPSTLLISPEGKVIIKDIKGEELEKVLAELIN
jgi:thiol-disulfide isomerase/thioredoxin